MAKGNFNIKINIKPTNQIIKNHNLQEDGPVNKFLRGEVARLSDPYVPMSPSGISGRGTLKDNKSYPDNHSIKYNSPYARYQYHGKVMVRKAPKQVTNKDLKYNGAPKRGSKWEKRMWSDKGKDVLKSIERFIKSGGK